MPHRRTRSLFEEGLILRINELRRHRAFPFGSAHRTDWLVEKCSSTVSITMVSNLDPAGDGTLTVICRAASAESHTRVLSITTRPSPWGRGRFVFFVCPQTGRRARTLYLPPGATEWGCYAVWPRNRYAHAIENLGRSRRTLARATRHRARIGAGPDCLDPLPPRRRGASRRVYERTLVAITAAEGGFLSRLSDRVQGLD
jgi:hypothetical protein